MKVNQFKRWRFALTAPDGQGIAQALGGAAVVLVLAALYFDLTVLLLLAAFCLALYAVLVKVGLEQYDRLGETAIEAAASAWVRSGENAEEVQRRYGCVMAMGAGAALAAAGASAGGFYANVDGTPMIPGTLTDVNGNPYGITENTFRDDFSFDAANSMALTPDQEYHSPMGMGNDDFMGTTDDFSSPSTDFSSSSNDFMNPR